ncbi:MAG: LptF/LptG family permease [Planctomycetaceae bacterium]
MWPPFPILQRYITRELVRVFLGLVTVLTVMLVFVGVVGEAKENGLGPLQILQILPYLVPSLLPFTIPATLLLTVCMVYGRMAGSSEITAAKAAGINLLSLLWPAFILSGVLSVSSMLLSDQMIPWAMANIQRTIAAAMEDILLDTLRTRHQVTDPARGVAITVMGVEDRTLIMPTFRYAPAGNPPVTVQAERATLEFDGDHSHVILHLVRGHVDIPGQRRVWFEREDRPFPMPMEIAQPKPRHQTIEDIRNELAQVTRRLDQARDQRDINTALALARGDFNALAGPAFGRYEYQVSQDRRAEARLRTEMHSRVALSLSCFVFVLVGAPVSILQARRQFLTTFIFCFFPILIGYYPVVLLMMNLSKSGRVEPDWSMWVANAVMLVVGMVLMRKVLRN